MHKVYYRTQNTVLTIDMHFSLTSLVCADFIVYGLSYRLDVAHLCITKTGERQSMLQCNVSPSPPSPILMHFSGQNDGGSASSASEIKLNDTATWSKNTNFKGSNSNGLQFIFCGQRLRRRTPPFLLPHKVLDKVDFIIHFYNLHNLTVL